MPAAAGLQLKQFVESLVRRWLVVGHAELLRHGRFELSWVCDPKAPLNILTLIRLSSGEGACQSWYFCCKMKEKICKREPERERDGADLPL